MDNATPLSGPSPRQLSPDQAATMPASLYLTGTRGPRLRDRLAIRWTAQPGLLIPLPTGVRWDTVRMPADLGMAVLTSLLASTKPERIGPVLLNEDTGHTYWLTTLGTQPDDTWSSIHPSVELLPPGTPVHMPDPCPNPLMTEFREGPELVTWSHWPTVTGTLTPAVWIAVTAAASHTRRAAPSRQGPT